MKKVFFIIAMAFMVCSVSVAQEQNNNSQRRHFDKTERVKMRTERMAKELGLTEAQTDSLLALNMEFADAMPGPQVGGRMPRTKLGNDTTKVKSFKDIVANRRTVMTEYETRLKGFLTDEQAKKYDENKKNRAANFNKRRPGMPGQRGGSMPNLQVGDMTVE